VTAAPPRVLHSGSRRGAARGYGRSARLLSIAIGTTGVVTFGYFALASHALSAASYGGVSVLWAVLFVVVSIIYRPIEQLLSRTIARRRARGLHEDHPLRVPALIQLGFALAFLLAALLLRHPLERIFNGAGALYWILVAGVLAYAASYFARGWLAGHERFALYGGLVLCEALSRFCFALAAVIGITHGQTAVALGIAAAPGFSLVVVPWALSRRATRAVSDPGLAADAASPEATTVQADAAADDDGLSLARGGRFAVSVVGIMVAEQALLNGPVLTVRATADAALAGVAFNLLLIARAPLQLFQAIQTTLLPHLTGLQAREGAEGFARAVRVTVLAILAFTAAVALALLAVGPPLMHAVFAGHRFDRVGLLLVACGMGLHLVSGTLNQAALARDRAALAAGAWLLAAALFIGWLTLPAVSDQLLRVELGYFGATGVLAGLLLALYRRPAGLTELEGENASEDAATHPRRPAHAPRRRAWPNRPRRS
jgi:O-antigen/teichoic acid export membrane protein